MEHFLIIGGGLAAHQAAKSIIETRPHTRVSMVSAEQHLPYDRPHLSKGLLTGENFEPALLAGSTMYAQAQLQRIGGTWVEQIDTATAQVRLDNARTLDYDRLIIATGSRVRRLPADLAHAPIHYLRTFEDALTLRSRLVDGAEVVIIGGGFIGLEVAAAARQRHCRVTVIESQRSLLARTGSPVLSEWIHALHSANDVNLELGVNIQHIEPSANGKIRVETCSGYILADLVIAGIGIQPNVELAQACGLCIDDGILVDSACTTSNPSIFAAGEVTRYPISHLGVRTRSESWTVASDQGGVAGRAAAGDMAAHYDEMPWLWSDQYSSSIQCIGLSSLATQYSYLGDPAADQWLALGWTGHGQFVCAIAANRGRDISAIKRALKRNEALPDIYASTLASAIPNPV